MASLNRSSGSWRVTIVVCFGFLLCSADGVAAEPSSRPNVVLILADDLGWSDVGCYGADLHETPRLDRLAGEGVRFTNAYAMSVCSPSRAALMTGKHPARLPITIWSEGSLGGPRNRRLLQARSLHDLPLDEVALAERFHDAGYLTALVGKWHLGDAVHYPEAQGFDVNIGGTLWGAPQTFFWPYSGSGRFGPEFRYVPHLEFGEPGEYLTDRLTDEALRVIDKAGEQPFFLYLSHHAPHTPIEAKSDDISHFSSKLNPDLHHQNAIYAAMVKSLDESVGRVIDHLDHKGLTSNTIVVFVSDNGGFIGKDKGQSLPVTDNSPLRSGKGSLYEGGIRVPMIVKWPDLIPSAAECDQPVVLMDLYPTLVSVLMDGGEANTQDDRGIVGDGVNLVPLLRDPTIRLDRGPLFFHYPHYYATTTPVGAVRDGDWKLIEYFEDERIELYNLRDDLSEQSDLAISNAAKAGQLRETLHTWRARIGAEMPSPNPDFNQR